MSYVLAIDVGTSFTAAALVKPGQGPIPAPEILSLGLHGSAVPSVLFYADDGRVLVGEAAERRGLDDPRRMVREFKRRIGDSVPLAVGDSWLAPEDVYARMARWVVDRAEEREGSAPSSIIMTHPAAWGQHRTSLVLAALNVAGLQDITLISEPEAAALHYASQTRVDDGSIVAVYDLGGGTFDTAVLRKAGAGNFELLGRPDGIETLGGADFDAAVLRHVMGHLGEGAALDASSPETLAALSRLRRECREAKEALSLDSEASVAVSLPGTQLSVRLVRSEFEAMIEAPVRDTVDALQRSLRSINLEAQDLSAVLLIGGSSRIPLVAELISVELDRPIAVDADPKSSICLGAAVAGLRRSGSSAVDAASTASALASAAEESVAGAALGRPRVPSRAPAFNHLKAASAKPGRHAPRPRVRMAAAAAAAATVLTIATATAAQSPEGTGLLATVFGNQAADVMRDGGAQAAGAAQASGAGAGSTPVIGGPAAGLEASAKTGVTRAGSNGRAPARQNATNPGAANAGTGAAANGSGNTAGTGAGGTSSGTAAGGTGGTTTPAAPGTGTSSPGTQAPGTQTPPPATTPPTTPEPDPTGGAASGPTPPPATTTPPPVTTDPTTPPVVEPTTPPVTPTDPGTPPPPPPPSPEPTVPQPEPTVVQDPPASPDPVLPQETTPPAVPDPIPTETSPTPDPALLSAV
ncbi:Hsp70 family protein [Paenarthrobacter nitroguajacolicus]|uniref:Hsp70 family protein n=1 Tax=Paenarthrobacter nitroguajacolicus TaxID=211146 RepID=UPI000AF99602|nr:Hsp70 family protein [Paenarthrobacter nitroguajacolicus]